jgi:hypothetical protein
VIRDGSERSGATGAEGAGGKRGPTAGFARAGEEPGAPSGLRPLGWQAKRFRRERQRLYEGPRFSESRSLIVCPAWAWMRGESPLGKLVAATHTNRKAASRESGPAVRPALKEAASELASRRTGSVLSREAGRGGYEALFAQGERAMNREALATKGQGRRSDGCARKSTNPYLGRSRLTPERATVPMRQRSEKSAEAVVAVSRSRQGGLPAYRKPKARRAVKGRTQGRANQP